MLMRNMIGLGWFPTVKKRLSEGEELENQFAGAGYCTKRGVINLNMQGITPPPKMTESQIESHLVGVVMAQQYSMKKAKDTFRRDQSNPLSTNVLTYTKRY